MKNFFILSALVALAILTSCNKQAIEESIVPSNQELPSFPVADNNDFSNIKSAGVADFTIDNEDSRLFEEDVLLLTNNSINAVSYLWSFGNGDTSTEANPTYKYEQHGYRTVTLTITDSYGKTHQTNNEIEVRCLFGGGDHAQ